MTHTRHATRPRLSVGAWWLATLPVAFMAAFFLWPTLALMARGLGLEGRATMPWSRVADAAWTTFSLATGATLLTLALGLPATWALTRRSWRGQRLAAAASTVPFVLPTIVVATAFSALVGPSNEPGRMRAVIVAALVFFNVAVVIRVVGPVWASLDDRTYWAARTLGASAGRAALHERLPALRGPIGAAAATVWMFCSTSFGVVLVLGGGRVSTLDTEIWIQANHFLNLQAAAVLGVLQIAMVAATLTIASRVRGRAERRTGAPSRRRRAGLDRDGGLVAAALLPAVVLTAAPLAALVSRAFRDRDGWTLRHMATLFSSERIPGTRGSALASLGLSVGTALAVGVIATALGLAVALVVGRSRRAGWVHALMVLPLGVSSVVVGLGTLLTLTRPLPGGLSLVTSGLLIPGAHLVIAIPLTVSVLVPAVRGIEPRLLAAAATLGSSPWRTFLHIQWPALRRAVGMAFGLAAAVSLGEFGATSFLARPGAETLPTLIYRLLGRPGPDNLGLAFAAATVLAVATAAIVLIADARHRAPLEARS